MKYVKPEVVASNSALEAIATVQLDKMHPLVQDRFPGQGNSAGAYEADE